MKGRQKSMERKIAEGYGQGSGNDYIPWLLVHEVPSRGLASRILGWKTERIHHLMSILESNYFYLLEWSDEVIDIQEQYPLLPIEETFKIAEQMNVKHPIDPKTRELNVVTTDFLISFKNNLGVFKEARAIKPSKELDKKRTLEKLEIEYRYWSRRNINWKIITEKQIPINMARNIKWLHSRRKTNGLPISESMIPEIRNALVDKIMSNLDEPLSKFTQEVDSEFQLPRGSSLAIVRHLIAMKQWQVDLSKKINPDRPLVLTRF